MAQQCAWRWALIGFIVTIVRGEFLLVGFDAIVRAALLSLIVGYGLGLTCGMLWQRAFD